MNKIDTLNQIAKILEIIAELLSSFFLIILFLIMLTQVILRYFFYSALPWGEEIIRYLIIWVVMLTGSILVKQDDLVKVDFLDKLWPKIFIIYRDLIYRLLFLAAFIFIIKEGWIQALVGSKRMMIGLTASGYNASYFLPYLSIPVGFALMFIQLFIFILSSFSIIQKKNKG